MWGRKRVLGPEGDGCLRIAPGLVHKYWISRWDSGALGGPTIAFRIHATGPSMDQKPRNISNFHLTRSLYSGSRAEVYQGRFAQAGGVVQLAAVKVLQPRFACIGHELRAFLAEAGWATELRSSLFPRVYEAGEHKGNYFIAMELVDGWTLAKVLASLSTLQVPLPCEVGLSIAEQIATGLHKMHEQLENDELLGMVHLGINPDNIMLSKEGRVRVLDFGQTLAAVDRELTEADEKGTVFQAPERLRGLPVDRRADIYSLGKVLQNMVDCMVPEVVREDLPALLARCCHRDSEQRFETMEDFKVALQLVAKNRGLKPKQEACEKFTLEIFGHKVAKVDPRSKRPQPVVPLQLASEGQKTSYEPVTPPAEALRKLDKTEGAVIEGEATAVGEVMKVNADRAVFGKATAIGDSETTAVGEVMDPHATVAGAPVDMNATSMGETMDPHATVMGAPADPNAGAAGGTSTSVESASDEPRFLDEHQAVTQAGGLSTANEAPSLSDPNISEDVTAFSKSAPQAQDPETDTEKAAPKEPGKGGFREELIPTKPYAAHNIDEDGA